jgi:carbamoyltransferase
MRIVGISPNHDSSIAVINNGELEYFFKEERLSRSKRDGPPILALQRLFEVLKEKPVDHACIAAPTGDDLPVKYITTQVKKILNCPMTDYCQHHHLSHASLAYYNSGFDEALIFIIDRNGSLIHDFFREAETVIHVSLEGEFNTLHKNFWVKDIGSESDLKRFLFLQDLQAQRLNYNVDSSMSIVKVYESATSLINQKPLENGKTMGLASYGRDLPFPDLFKGGRPLDREFVHGYFVMDDYSTPVYKDYITKITPVVSEENYQFYADYAYQVQKQTQEVALSMIKEWTEKTGIKNVCITGGYGLNVVANQHYIKNLPEINFYFEPLADDSGNSIGSALHLYHMLVDDRTKRPLRHTFVHGITSDIPCDIGHHCEIRDIAKFLLDQKTVAVFNGMAESGPRALGNRSILFDPRNPDAKKIVNRIKKREWYRPFAAMVLEEDFSMYFHTMGLEKSEFMTVSFNAKTNDIPGVIHVDNTCRVQTVSTNIPHINNLLNEFKDLSGCSVLLNTSFNLAGEPLVDTFEDAIRTFKNSELDILWFPEVQRYLEK